MLDLNNNGVLDPEEDALENILAEEAAVSDNPRKAAVPWLLIGIGITVVLLIIVLFVIAL